MVRAVSGETHREIWEEMAYAEGLHYCLIWWRDFARDVAKFDSLMHCISGAGSIRKIEALKIGSSVQQNLV